MTVLSLVELELQFNYIIKFFEMNLCWKFVKIYENDVEMYVENKNG